MNDNYIKIRSGRKAEHVFFETRKPYSVGTARLLADTVARATHERAQAEAEVAAATSGVASITVEPPTLAVFRHGAPGLGHLPCVGGCELCRKASEAAVEDDPETDGDA